jgi:CDP-diacylglycerol---glycerol-3-phosphate 3-phosphatidyltransferase
MAFWIPMTLANSLSLLRLALLPVQAGLAFAGQAGPFLATFAAAMASDVVDGQVARRLGQATPLGAKLDSIADLATWAFLPLCLFWLWPDVITAQAPWLAVAIVAFALPTTVGLLRWGRLTSYHTFGAKLCSWAMAVGALALVVAGEDALFHAATLLLALSAIEELAITFVLPSWRADVPSLLHALRARDAA